MTNSPAFVLVIGTSAGGMPALTQLIAQLDATLPAAVLVVQHLAPNSTGEPLVARLNQHSALHCQLAQDGALLAAGQLYLAPPDRHLLVKDGRLLVTKGPRENNYRPSVDALFRSAAVAYGPRTIGVVLTGMLHDGTAGLDFVKRCGGLAVVQDPADAEFSSMPESALLGASVDYTVDVRRMGELLRKLTAPAGPPRPAPPVPEDLRIEAAIAERVMGSPEEVNKIGHLASLACPDCGGALWELNQGKMLRYRCHTGHAFTADGLLKQSQQAMEETLWVALRMMEERKILLTSMASRGEGFWSVQQEERLEEIKRHINRLREFLVQGQRQENNGLSAHGEQEEPAA